MTVVVGFGMPSCAILVADCRLTRGVDSRDVCQKIFPLSDAALVGFSGGARSAVHVVKTLVDAGLANDLSWLLDSDAAEATILPVYRELPGSQVSLLFALRWLERVTGSDLVVPSIRLVRVDCDPFRHSLMQSGLAVLGSGGYIEARLVETQALEAVAGFPSWEDERGRALQALLAAIVVVRRLISERPEPTVGGLYQICYLTFEGVRAVPYYTGEETHPVSMTIERGVWVQEDRRNRSRVVVRNPLEDDSFLEAWSGPETFDGAEPAIAQRQRVQWVASLRQDDDAVYGYEESTLAFTHRIPLPSPPRGPSVFGKLVQPLIEADWLADWIERQK